MRERIHQEIMSIQQWQITDIHENCNKFNSFMRKLKSIAHLSSMLLMLNTTQCFKTYVESLKSNTARSVNSHISRRSATHGGRPEMKGRTVSTQALGVPHCIHATPPEPSSGPPYLKPSTSFTPGHLSPRAVSINLNHLHYHINVGRISAGVT